MPFPVDNCPLFCLSAPPVRHGKHRLIYVLAQAGYGHADKQYGGQVELSPSQKTRLSGRVWWWPISTPCAWMSLPQSIRLWCDDGHSSRLPACRPRPTIARRVSPVAISSRQASRQHKAQRATAGYPGSSSASRTSRASALACRALAYRLTRSDPPALRLCQLRRAPAPRHPTGKRYQYVDKPESASLACGLAMLRWLVFWLLWCSCSGCST